VLSGVGAVVGSAVGVAMSVYVGMRDLRSRQAGIRARARYRSSLVVVPLVMAAVGAFAGLLVDRLV
jgi:hypothetical protein